MSGGTAPDDAAGATTLADIRVALGKLETAVTAGFKRSDEQHQANVHRVRNIAQQLATCIVRRDFDALASRVAECASKDDLEVARKEIEGAKTAITETVERVEKVVTARIERVESTVTWVVRSAFGGLASALMALLALLKAKFFGGSA